jgi:hypothetical protein
VTIQGGSSSGKKLSLRVETSQQECCACLCVVSFALPGWVLGAVTAPALADALLAELDAAARPEFGVRCVGSTGRLGVDSSVEGSHEQPRFPRPGCLLRAEVSVILDLLLDVRVALRRLCRSPMFTVFALASLALGIGVSTAVYSCVHTLFWRPLGIERAERVVPVLSGSPPQYGIAWSDFHDLRRQQSSFSTLSGSWTRRLPVVAGHTARTVIVEAVSGDYFAMLGIQPTRGKLLQPADENLGERVAAISESFWRTKLDASPHVVVDLP